MHYRPQQEIWRFQYCSRGETLEHACDAPLELPERITFDTYRLIKTIAL